MRRSRDGGISLMGTGKEADEASGDEARVDELRRGEIEILCARKPDKNPSLKLQNIRAMLTLTS